MLSRRDFVAASAVGLVCASAGLRPAARAEVIGKNARLVVGWPPGGSSDAVARLIAEKLRGTYAPTIVVDNKPGAAGRIGLEQVKGSDSDGSVMIQTPASMLVIYPHIYQKLTYDPLKDFTPVTSVCVFQFAVSVGPAVPAEVKTVADFVQWSKANAQQNSYGSPGEGTMAHFAGVMFARAAGLQLSHVPYKGGAPAIQDLIGGQIPASINVLSEALPHAKSGKLRVLATTGAMRSPFLPEAPTLKEAGFKDFEVEEYFGMFVPSKTPPEIVEKLAAAIREALKAPDVQERLAQLAFQPAGTTPANFAEIVKADLEKWGPIVKSTGFSLTD